jgi:pimeloyl-ACP methyl ester carboxylesterase
MQRFPDHSAQPSEERVTYANHRRTGASLRLPMAASGQMSQFDLRYTDEVEPLYANVRCPTLILWGEADQWLPIEAGYRLRDRIPGARFQAVAGSGHLMQEDVPEAIVGALYRFLPEVVAS